LRNHSLNSQPRISNEELDRLVDGELSLTQQRALFDRLQSEPDGWRRCALVFLEQQAVVAALRGAGDASSGQSGATSEQANSASPLVMAGPAAEWPNALSSCPRRPWPTLIAVLLAGLVGTLGGYSWRPSAIQRERPQATRPSVEQTVPETDSLEDPPPAVFVRFGRATNQGQLELPLMRWADWRNHPDWLAESAVPRELDGQLRQTGHAVSRSWRYFPVRLSDGREAVVPVEQVELRRVSAGVVP
jgi:hypothetical protein